MLDRELLRWATPTQARYLEAINEHGSGRAAARAVGVAPSAVQRSIKGLKHKAALQGYSPEHDMVHPVPDGFKVRGVSTYYNSEGKAAGQWVKSSRENEAVTEETVRLFVEHLIGDAKGAAPYTPPPLFTASDIMVTYLFGDPHFGMKSTSEDGGDDFDLAAADRLTRAGIDRMARCAPDTDEALLIVIGDNTHSNDSSHMTPANKHLLSMDTGGHNAALLVSAKAWAYSCRKLLEKHKRVTLWFMPGNHDPDASFALAVCLAMHFENEPRLTVDLSRSLYRHMLFGKVLIGAHHGHGAKQVDLPLLMAVDNPKEWGASEVRYCFQGHIHHDSVKEVQGVRVESIRTLAGKDAWHGGKGYRSMRDTRAIVYHKDFGEFERHTVSAAMLEAT